MPTLANSLFLRVATLSFVGKIFEYPPFDLEFEITLGLGGMNSTTAKLYNPSTETIKALEKGSGLGAAGRSYGKCQIDAGYQNAHGLCVSGEICDFKVRLHPPDRILELKIVEQASAWTNAVVPAAKGSIRNTTATQVLRLVCGLAGIQASIQLGQEKQYPAIVVTNVRDAIIKICRDTNSIWTFANGTLTILPQIANVFTVSPQATLISKNTGLVGKPEETIRGLKFKSLFLYQVQCGHRVLIQSGDINAPYTVFTGKKKFSTFNDGVSEFEVVK